MKSPLSALLSLSSVVRPLSAPVGADPTRLPRAATWWKALCALCVIPGTALIHHAVLRPGSCILNGFGSDYSAAAIGNWLRSDPSIAWASVISFIVYWLGLRSAWVRALAAPAFLAGLPLAVWLWDIPFTGRAICAHCHDLQVKLPVLGALRTLHFYMLGVALFVPLAALVLARNAGALTVPGRRPAPAFAGPVARGETISQLRPRPAMPADHSWVV